jgi:hypothetical protein
LSVFRLLWEMKLTNLGSLNLPRESLARPKRMAGRWKRFLIRGGMDLRGHYRHFEVVFSR